MPQDLFFAEKDCLDSLHDAADKFRQLTKRIDNWLSLRGCSYVEEYRRGRLAVACDLEIMEGAQDTRNFVASGDNQRHVPHYGASIILTANSIQGRYLHNWKQQPVFVENVQFVKSPEGVIPSLMGFYNVHDEVANCFGGLMYSSAMHGGYKFIPSLSDGESSVARMLSSSQKNDIIDGEIQSGLQVVDSIPNDERSIVWEGFSCLELKNILSGIRVFLDTQIIEVSGGEGEHPRVKVIDVMLGPLNL